jgi:hypothetical protein
MADQLQKLSLHMEVDVLRVIGLEAPEARELKDVISWLTSVLKNADMKGITALFIHNKNNLLLDHDSSPKPDSERDVQCLLFSLVTMMIRLAKRSASSSPQRKAFTARVNARLCQSFVVSFSPL